MVAELEGHKEALPQEAVSAEETEAQALTEAEAEEVSVVCPEAVADSEAVREAVALPEADKEVVGRSEALPREAVGAVGVAVARMLPVAEESVEREGGPKAEVAAEAVRGAVALTEADAELVAPNEALLNMVVGAAGVEVAHALPLAEGRPSEACPDAVTALEAVREAVVL